MSALPNCPKCSSEYTYEDGSEVVLNDGNTFIQIVPTASGVTIG